ncbi:MAG TPA: hypothetical protein VFM70_05895 [Salinimicrobium sp.]|nr:hypothetical protein [Salinimicrobium sp.]
MTKVRAGQIRGIAKTFAPILRSIEPVFMLPNASGELIMTGEFFNPETTVEIEGCTVNSFEFVSTTEIRVAITTGVTEGYFDVSFDNGLTSVYVDGFIVSLGEVTVPEATSWTNIQEPISFETGSVLLDVFNSLGKARLNIELDVTTDFQVRFSQKRSALGSYPVGANYYPVKILSSSDDSVLFQLQNYNNVNFSIKDGADTQLKHIYANEDFDIYEGEVIVEYKEGLWTFYAEGFTYTALIHNNLINNVWFDFSVRTMDIKDIKIIQL